MKVCKYDIISSKIYIFNDSGDEWRKRFYWNCDCLSSEDGNKLRCLEEAVFRSQKASIVKEMKKRKWDGSNEMNKLADITVSDIFKKALLQTEG